ncbi:hypothetical protein LX32DRAFT_718434 [Colletotrichum zoysiae]|uniref:Uncharacterized protein n=1 Tax=Colletotrichum zoysiae TaxID=1216348 RepID=A0AAD9HKA0_9PEZI|nr:hypothetical protein LX32DRAFT_718434 [Colletotrichum zoysiae]
MCTYSYLHHHHVQPCARPIDYVVHYEFCLDAEKDSDGTSQAPCDRVSYDPVQSIDFDNPCATGGCLISPDCSSGNCRLKELNGQWICCQCSRGSNSLRWCRHKMKKSPDTFCYHRVCQNCTSETET